MINSIFLFLFFFLGLVIDKIWFLINYSKYEKGFEAHEHYHIALEIGFLAVILNYYELLGLSFAFLLAEWSQDHYFAYKSGHFKESTIIGICLLIGLISLSILWV